MDEPLALRFAVALGLGILIGLERERAKGAEGGAGVRTFALIALAGAIAGHLDQTLGLGWLASPSSSRSARSSSVRTC